MVNLSRWRGLDRMLGFDRHPQDGHRDTSRHHWLHEEETLLAANRDEYGGTAIPPLEVTKVCLRLRHLVQECIPCEMEENKVTRPHSRIVTKKVVQAAKEAGGQEYKACVVFCLLVNKQWFKHESITQLWDADLHKLRATACGVIAKAIIENEENSQYLLHTVLLRRYSYISDREATHPVNVIEKAVDLHDVRVIGSSGYQRCISYLWRGWLVQDENDPSYFIDYKDKANTSYFVHMDPDRMRAPMYQSAAQMLFSLIYLGLYTAAVTWMNASGEFDGAEILMYIFTVGFACDEVMKLYKAGYHILGFWNALNGLLYAFLAASFVLRVIGLHYPLDTKDRIHFSQLSYRVLSFVAPLFWARLLLYLDTFRFFGAMLVVLKVMMKESVIFFALLIIINIGFLQAFIGLDLADDLVAEDIWFIVESMLKAILQSPEFEGFEKFGHPFGLILHYCFTFIVMIILLNILIALYNSAYEDIYENADDEYLALLAQKTMQFVRAPDENVYIAPFNLIEIVVSALFEWWMPKKTYEFINDIVMGIIYSPLLVVTAILEVRKAKDIRRNRARGEEDDDVEEEWEQIAHDLDFETEGWAKVCESVKPNVEEQPAIVEVKKLQTEVEELKRLLSQLIQTTKSGAGDLVELEKDKGGKKSSEQESDEAGPSSGGSN